MSKGIVIASDHHTEWLLPWWWKYYSRYNDYPVAIVDLGMTSSMRQWCAERGKVISLTRDVVVQEEVVDNSIREKWQSTYLGDVWTARQAWFKKPLACLQTPFDLTVWIDVDCEVCGHLGRLFDEWIPGIELALVHDERIGGNVYSSGVILYAKEASFLHAWAEACLSENKRYMGDQDALTDLLLGEKIAFKELDPIYNWIMFQGVNFSALIAHWGAAWGKEYIRKHGGLHQLMGEGFVVETTTKPKC